MTAMRLCGFCCNAARRFFLLSAHDANAVRIGSHMSTALALRSVVQIIVDMGHLPIGAVMRLGLASRELHHTMLYDVRGPVGGAVVPIHRVVWAITHDPFLCLECTRPRRTLHVCKVLGICRQCGTDLNTGCPCLVYKTLPDIRVCSSCMEDEMGFRYTVPRYRLRDLLMHSPHRPCVTEAFDAHVWDVQERWPRRCAYNRRGAMCFDRVAVEDLRQRCWADPELTFSVREPVLLP